MRRFFLAALLAAGTSLSMTAVMTPAKAEIVTLRLYAAGSLKAALSEVTENYMRYDDDVLVETTFGPSGLLRERIEKGETADVFASADMKHPQALEKAIKQLPDKYRIAFILRDVQELPYDEVAKVLDVPLGTVKSRVNRARLMLREKLQPRMEEQNALSKGTLLPVGLL